VKKFCICVDVGATRLRVGLGMYNGEIIDVLEESTQNVVLKYRDSNAISIEICNLVDKLLTKHNLSIEDIEGIGIGSIGPLDIKRGIIVKPPNLPISDIEYDIKNYIEDKYRVRVVVLNDCVTAVWGEKWFGVGRDYKNIVYVTFSTGIGGGVIVNDTLLLGADGNAHEVGHVVVDTSENALRCGCGGLGHWEAYCSGVGIPKFAEKLAREELAREYQNSPIKKFKFEKYDEFTRAFFKYLNDGDEFCLKMFEKICKFNAIGISTIIHYYNPEIIILGGSIALNNPDKILQFRKYLTQYLMRGIRIPEIRITSLGDYAILKGAIALVFNTPLTYTQFVTK